MSKLQNKVNEIYDKASNMNDKLDVEKIRSEAESIILKLNRPPQQQQHSTRDKGMAR